MLKLNHLAGFGGGLETYITTAVFFDGTNDRIQGSTQTGMANGKEGLFSCWVDLRGGDAADMKLFASVNARIEVVRTTSNTIRIIGRNSGGTIILSLTSTTTYTAADAWFHVLGSWDLANANGWLYINDSDDLAGGSTLTNDTIDYVDPDYGVGGLPGGAGGGSKLNADMAEFYFDTNTFLDLSVASNRRKFINSGLKPVNLDTDGSRPTGLQPVMYFNDPVPTFETNKGTGANFTEVGALTAGASSPSD